MNAFDKLKYADNIGDPRGYKIHLLENCKVHHRNKEVYNKYPHSNCPKNIHNLHSIQHVYYMSITSVQLQARIRIRIRICLFRNKMK